MRQRALFLNSGLSLAAIVLFGCASAQEAQRDARARVEHSVESRLGLSEDALALEESRAVISATVHDLLLTPLTEESAIRVALLNHRGISATLHDLGISAAEWVQAGLLTNPVLQANAKLFDSGTEVELGLSQSFLDAFYLPLRRHVAAAELAAAEARVAGEVIGIVFEVRRAVLDWQTARALVEVQRAFVEAEDAALVLTSELHRAGNVTDPILTAAQAAHVSAQIELATAEAAARERLEPLQVLLGLWGAETAWSFNESTVNFRADPRAGLALFHLEAQAVRASLDLAAAEAGIEAAAQRAGLASWEAWVPSADLGLVAKREASNGEWGFGPAFALGLPLLDPGRARTSAAEAALRRAVDLHYQKAVEVRSAARTFRERLIALEDATRYFRDVYLPLRSQLVLETLQNFNGMQIGVFEVLLVKQQEVEARRDLLALTSQAWHARLDLEELLAGRLNQERLAHHLELSTLSTNRSMQGGHSK